MENAETPRAAASASLISNRAGAAVEIGKPPIGVITARWQMTISARVFIYGALFDLWWTILKYDFICCRYVVMYMMTRGSDRIVTLQIV